MIKKIDEKGQNIIRRFSDDCTNVPAALRPYITIPGCFQAGELNTTSANKQTDILKRYK